MSEETKRAYIARAATVEWGTPQKLFDALNKRFKFTLDVAAAPDNAKCARYFTEKENGLAQSWRGERVWCNPPYGTVLREWVAKARAEAEGGNATVVMLLPARTDTKWFHDHVLPAGEIEFVKGRLKFGGQKNSAPFPSMIVVFNGATP